MSVVAIFFDIIRKLGNDVKQSKLKEIAIIQLGYSRGGINVLLPDELIHVIKEYVFYDIQNPKVQEMIASSIFSKYTLQISQEFDFQYNPSDTMYNVLQICFMDAVQTFVANDVNKIENLYKK